MPPVLALLAGIYYGASVLSPQSAGDIVPSAQDALAVRVACPTDGVFVDHVAVADDGWDDVAIPQLRRIFDETLPRRFERAIGDLSDWVEIDHRVLPAMVGRIEVGNGHLVDPERLTTLRGVLAEFMLAFKQGSASAILAERLRSDYVIREDAKRWHASLLQRFFTDTGEALPEDPEQVMRLVVDRHFDGREGSGYRNLYNALSVDGSRIEIHEADSMPMPMFAHLKTLWRAGVWEFPNGFVRHLPSVDYEHSPASVLAEHEQITYADVWLAATDAEARAYARFRRYYWSPRDVTWLPMEMVSLNARRRVADTFF